jgi:hypothetical protein
MFLHTFYTWLLANILHPLVLVGFVLTLHPEVAPYLLNSSFFEGFIYLAILSMVASFPCLLLSWGCLHLISAASHTIIASFFMWAIVTTSLIIVTGILVLDYYETLRLSFSDYLACPVITFAIAAVIRFKQFKRAIELSKINEHETNNI